MEQARLWDRPEDYKRLGVNPNQIEVWEDQRRNTDPKAGNWEWWYFDSILDDGTKAVIQFFTKAGMRNVNKDGDTPSLTIKITLPDGTLYEQKAEPKADICHFGTGKCDVHLGEHSFVGDFKQYHIHVEPIKGVGADLTLVSHSKPYRPGTAYFGFGENTFYTWLCAVPKGEVSGTLTVNGKQISVHGSGYHDHQWGNKFFMSLWNHWLWSRQNFGDDSMLVFDFVTSEEYGFARMPIAFIQNADGDTVFESRHGVKCKILDTYVDEKASGKTYPKKISYIFTDGNKKAVYTLTGDTVLEAQGFAKAALPLKLVTKLMKMDRMAYTRYAGQGALMLTAGKEVVERSGSLIYEIMYPGEDCAEHMAVN